MNIHFERVLLLTKVPLFSYLRSDQLNRIAPLLSPVVWTKGERIFTMGDMGLELYIITDGHVGVTVDPDPNATPRVYVNELKTGDTLGEMALIDNELRSATAFALKNTQALMLDKEKLYSLLMSYPELSIGMLRALSQRLRNISAKQTITNNK